MSNIQHANHIHPGFKTHQPTPRRPIQAPLDWQCCGRRAWKSLMLSIWASTREQDRVKADSLKLQSQSLPLVLP